MRPAQKPTTRADRIARYLRSHGVLKWRDALRMARHILKLAQS